MRERFNSARRRQSEGKKDKRVRWVEVKVIEEQQLGARGAWKLPRWN